MMGLSQRNPTVRRPVVSLPTSVPIYIPNTKLKFRSAVFLKTCWIPDTVLSIAWKRKEVSGTFQWLQDVHRLKEKRHKGNSNLQHPLKIEWWRQCIQPGLKAAITAGVNTQRQLTGAEKGGRGLHREQPSWLLSISLPADALWNR